MGASVRRHVTLLPARPAGGPLAGNLETRVGYSGSIFHPLHRSSLIFIHILTYSSESVHAHKSQSDHMRLSFQTRRPPHVRNLHLVFISYWIDQKSYLVKKGLISGRIGRFKGCQMPYPSTRDEELESRLGASNVPPRNFSF